MLLDPAAQDVATFMHGRNRVTYELLARSPVTQLLDYGCGQAQFAIAAASELGLTVYACDTDRAVVDALRSDHGEVVDFFTISESAPRLPFDDRQISAVICCDVLEHMTPAARLVALCEMQRVLCDDGAIVITTPHKGLLSPLDPENAKYHFPRAHRLAYRLVKGRQKYEMRYGGERFGNFSTGARRHEHFSTGELSAVLAQAGFEVEEARYFTLIYPVVRVALWVVESLASHMRGLDRLKDLLWKLYRWDADIEPGRLAFCVGIRARPRR
jgi:ubiquinone/menaquinone biosynthesis C-methylase UbiE